MHILWFNDEASLAGGCEHYIQRTEAGLAKKGVRSTLLYSPLTPTDPQFLRQFSAAFPDVDAAAQISRIKPDLIFVHQLAADSSLDAIRRSGIPAVRFIHDHRLFCLRDYKYTTLGHHTCTRKVGWGCYPCLGFVRRSPHWPGLQLVRVGSLLRKQRASWFFDAILAGSRYMADHIVAHGFDPHRVHVVPLFIEPALTATSIPRLPNQLLFVGQLLRGKGIDVLLRALPLMRASCRLWLAGGGKQQGMFEEMARNLGLEARVEFLGKLTRAELATKYQESTLLVFPSRSPETFGLVGLEAMTHGTPVVATQVGGIGEWLRHEVNGLGVPSGDSAALARALDRLVSNPAEARRMGEAGRRLAQERFQPHHHIDRLYELFSSLVNNRRTVPA